jgi:hypothetical protein
VNPIIKDEVFTQLKRLKLIVDKINWLYKIGG